MKKRLGYRCLTRILVIAVVAWVGRSVSANETARNGKQVYRELCVRCHGDSGQGVEEQFTKPLVGDKSVAQLVTFIEKRMPEDAPQKCVGEDARRVARYIYDAFYSPLAQARRKAARIELSRLTVRQYRNAVADLVGSFRDPPRRTQRQGLSGRYYNRERPGRRPDLERTDAQVRFQFGPSNLPPEPLDKIKGFSVRWEGSIIAPDTGQYEVVVRTNHGARLWLNEREKPLIDAWVQSGDETRHTASMFLLGGRAYPIRLEFSSRQQGVDDKKKYEDKPREAFIELRFKPPHGVEQVVPSRLLMPEPAPELFVVTTPFPPDDQSTGYVRGTSISEAWNNAATAAAIETAHYVTDHLAEFAGRRANEADAAQRFRTFCGQFLERAFRRPLSNELKSLYIDRQFAEAPDLETAVKRVVMLTLMSPRFLYLDPGGEATDSYIVASRLSFTLWDSLPDARLLEAAAAGRLTSPHEIAQQAARMIEDPRTRSKLREFLHTWLKLEEHGDLAKDKTKYPEFDGQLVADLRTSLELFLDDVVWNNHGDFRDLLRSDKLYVNGRLAAYYGYDLPADAPFQEVKSKHAQRVGVLSHPYLMAAFAYTDSSSPIHRGVFLIRSVLGRTLRPPPQAFTPVPPALHPDMTTRERVAMQTKSETCQACHGMINSVGFTLEHFDAVGRFRETEQGKPIDASGAYQLLSGKTQTFRDARDLAEFFAESPETHHAFVVQLFHHLVKQPVEAYGTDVSAGLQRTFAEQNYSIPKLMAEIAERAALVGLEQKANASSSDSSTVSRADDRASQRDPPTAPNVETGGPADPQGASSNSTPSP